MNLLSKKTYHSVTNHFSYRCHTVPVQYLLSVIKAVYKLWAPGTGTMYRTMLIFFIYCRTRWEGTAEP
jgi:hypothetical protein